MNTIKPEKIFRQIPDFHKYSTAVSRWIHDKVLEGGETTRTMADILHGTWLGHPFHPVLTDFTIGAWLLGSLFDLFSLGGNSRTTKKAADRLIALGTLSAVPTALAGIIEYSTITRGAMTTGASHGLINTVALILYTMSMRSRKANNRGTAVFLSAMALGLITVSAWLGGELVYKYRVSVNKIEEPKEPKDWVAVLDDLELREQEPRRVDVQGHPVLLYRYNGTVYAIGAVCGHEGGPLDEGKFDGYCVECPWHQSVYDLRDGTVVHGPTTYAEPGYETRVLNGKVELRLKESQV